MMEWAFLTSGKVRRSASVWSRLPQKGERRFAPIDAKRFIFGVRMRNSRSAIVYATVEARCLRRDRHRGAIAALSR